MALKNSDMRNLSTKSSRRIHRCRGKSLQLLVLAIFVFISFGSALYGQSITKVRHFDTWQADPQVILSTDPAGIAFYFPSGTLYIADSEINEISAIFDGDNIFEISLLGDALTREITSSNSEPTGITYNEHDGYFYVTNDDTRLISRYDLNLNSPLYEVSTEDAVSSAYDPEGITSDPSTGLLYIVNGITGGPKVLVYNEDLVFQSSFDLTQAPDYEGIAFHSPSNHLFIVSGDGPTIFEYTVMGDYIDEYDLSAFSPEPVAAQGLTFAPTSDTEDDPNDLSIYIADGMIDNDINPDERDGRIFEAVFSWSGILSDFVGSPVSGGAPMEVFFTDSSTGDVSIYSWDFGDGSTSSEQNPSHIYTAAGTYTVSLTVDAPGRTDTNTKTNYITVTNSAPVADFSGTPRSGDNPLSVIFSDLSTGTITGYSWDFGDTGTSTEPNPSHIYADAGTYTVILTVTGPLGSDFETKTDYITVTEPPFAAEFSGTPLTGDKPLAVNFTDESTGTITSWDWDFGDGNTSTDQDPSNTYTVADTYTVSLTVNGPGTTDTIIKTDYITVTEPAPVADFSGTPLTGDKPLSVTFSDLSTGSITGWSWDFGDSSTSTLQNPPHTYASAGTYTVSLTVTGPGGIDSKTEVDYITVTEPPPEAAFSGTPLSGNKPLSVTFSDLSTGPITSWDWDFGDSSTSTLQNPSHSYSETGTYTVSLTVTGPGGSDPEIKTDYITVTEPPVADFSGTPLSGNNPLEVTFTDQSTGNITDWSWNFGDSYTSSVPNPPHTYSSAGTYTVILTVTGPGGSDTETKVEYITVTEPAPMAAFSGTPTNGVKPLNVSFTSQSTGTINTYSWELGDGNTSSFQNLSHNYPAAGTYTVSLTVTGPGGNDTETKVDYITVTEPAPEAAFSGTPLNGGKPLAVTFSDLSTGAITSWSWDFGDSSTSTLQNPIHTYTDVGTYTVILTVSGPGGTDPETKTNYITVSNPAPVAAFSGSPLNGSKPLAVNFTNQSTGIITGTSWNFGDSSTSTLQNPSHTYTEPGIYTVSLTVSGPGGSDSETKTNYITVTEPPPVAAFSASPQSGNTPLTVTFINQSTGSIYDYSWDLGDGSTSSFQNLSHTYSTAGTYTVSLTVTGPGGSNTAFSIIQANNTSIVLNRTQLYFGAVTGAGTTGSQDFMISNGGTGIINWSVTDDKGWINCSPISGVNSAIVTVTVNPSGLSVGKYVGTVRVSDPNAANSPQYLTVNFEIYASGEESPPIGFFDTPINGQTVSGSVPVTGWALDDLEVKKVEIKRDPDPDDPPAAIGSDGLIYIGEAIFVKGSRPDVEGLYPTYPFNDRSGWGYMMLTYGLPRQGNGTFKLHAFAEDISGHRILLGTKQITINNTDRLKPFGTIDTPVPGEVISGSSYLNFGWALTPPSSTKKFIPFDGSTVFLLMDGVILDNIDYGDNRADIAGAFPETLNANTAGGHKYIDTTKYANGVHTMSWYAVDNEGYADGFGSRYFEIQNLGGEVVSVDGLENLKYGDDTSNNLKISVEGPQEINVDQLERVQIQLKTEGGDRIVAWGADKTKRLPVGSTLDGENGVFYWSIGPGFLNEHILHFAVTDGVYISNPVEVVVNIAPKIFEKTKRNEDLPLIRKVKKLPHESIK
ncbi:PKD domain-containing protein [Acidobacteriota bacterium]